MKGYDWIGHIPSEIRWGPNGETIFFNWNPENAPADSLYKVSLQNQSPSKVTSLERKQLLTSNTVFDRGFTKITYTKSGDLYYHDLDTNSKIQFTNTVDRISSPRFTRDSKSIIYTQNDNLFQLQVNDGTIHQLTYMIKGSVLDDSDEPEDPAEKWLYRDQLKLSQVLKERLQKKEATKKWNDLEAPERPLKIYLENKRVSHLQISPDLNFITYRLSNEVKNVSTQVPNYVTNSGFAKNINARAKVGTSESSYQLGIYDRKRDTTYQVNTKPIPGITDQIDYPNQSYSKGDKERSVLIQGPVWSDDGKHALIQVRSLDNKDRWLMTLDMTTGEPSLIDRQQDPAWINGPGIGYIFSSPAMGWMPDNENIWFQSETSGYSHLYLANIKNGKTKALTSGAYEVYKPQLSRDKKFWYFSTNQKHSGERHFYQMPAKGGKAKQLTFLPGRSDVTLSPDEKWMAITNSTSNQPWELYLMKNPVISDAPPEPAKRITNSLNSDFKSYDWREPQYVAFTARDGVKVPARLYKPENPEPNGPGIVFVHGAGYLQNAHKWWSSYYREYMFHNFLVDHGYTVLDIDYRGSSGYGRDWRTAIYQHMGGKDLTDQIDGAKYLVDSHQIDPGRLGIYGGSYGGFITLMAMFKEPDTFIAGAALRSVTDWAHYNDGYTSNILNQPILDSLAYVKSSPIYYAEGLKGHLLMLHGMVDTNVQFQDVVRLSQRLIELGKDNWELAVFPLEGHGFVESSSWTDEYKRIFKLFEEHLK